MSQLFNFNFYYSPPFWLWFVLYAVLFRAGNFGLRLRNVFLYITSILMLLALPRFDLYSLLFLTLLSFVTFHIGNVLNLSQKGRTGKLLLSAGGVGLILLILAYFKYHVFQAISYKVFLHRPFEPSNFIFIIGISYLSFKMMHFVVEGYKQKLSNVTVLSYLNYIFFFPSFISGPINRYNHFSSQISDTLPGTVAQDLRAGIQRIIHGLFKKIVVCTILYPHAFWGMHKSLVNLGSSELVIALYASALYMYFDLSAYSDIAIGCARTIGFELPENFNNPFFKKNLQQFWANYHISLTSWLTDYIYWPICKKFRNQSFLKRHPLLLSNISIIITFTVCGMWHGESMNFVLWGVFHGTGLACVKLFQYQKRQIKHPLMRRYFLSSYSNAFGAVVTFHFFALGMLLLAYNVDEIVEFIIKIL